MSPTRTSSRQTEASKQIKTMTNDKPFTVLSQYFKIEPTFADDIYNASKRNNRKRNVYTIEEASKIQ